MQQIRERIHGIVFSLLRATWPFSDLGQRIFCEPMLGKTFKFRVTWELQETNSLPSGGLWCDGRDREAKKKKDCGN